MNPSFIQVFYDQYTQLKEKFPKSSDDTGSFQQWIDSVQTHINTNKKEEIPQKMIFSLISRLILSKVYYSKNSWNILINTNFFSEDFMNLFHAYLYKFSDINYSDEEISKVLAENKNIKYEKLFLIRQVINQLPDNKDHFIKQFIEISHSIQHLCSIPPESTQILSLKVLESLLLPQPEIIQIALDSVKQSLKKGQTAFVKSQACHLYSKILQILLYYSKSLDSSFQFQNIYQKYSFPSHENEILIDFLHSFDYVTYGSLFVNQEFLCTLMINNVPSEFEYIYQHLSLENCLSLFKYLSDLFSTKKFPILNHLQTLLSLCTDKTQLTEIGNLLIQYNQNQKLQVPDFHFLDVISQKLIDIDSEWCSEYYDQLIDQSPTPSLGYLIKILSEKLELFGSSSFSSPEEPSYWYSYGKINAFQFSNDLEDALTCSNPQDMIQALGIFFKNHKEFVDSIDSQDDYDSLGEFLLKNINNISLSSLISYPSFVSKLFNKPILDQLITFFIQKAIEQSPGHQFYETFITNPIASPETLILLENDKAKDKDNTQIENTNNNNDNNSIENEKIEKRFSKQVLKHFSEIFGSISTTAQQSIILSLTTAQHNLKTVYCLLISVAKSQTGKNLLPINYLSQLFTTLSSLVSNQNPDYLLMQILSELISILLSNEEDQNKIKDYLQKFIFTQAKPYSCIFIGSLSNYVHLNLELLKTSFSFLKQSLSSSFCIPFSLHSLQNLFNNSNNNNNSNNQEKAQEKAQEAQNNDEKEEFQNESSEILKLLLNLISSNISSHPFVLASISKVFISIIPYLKVDFLPEVDTFLCCIFFNPISLSKSIFDSCIHSLENTPFSSLISQFDFKINFHSCSNQKWKERQIKKIRKDPYSLKSFEIAKIAYQNEPKKHFSFLCDSLKAANLKIVHCVYHEFIQLLKKNTYLFKEMPDAIEKIAIYGQSIEEVTFLEFYFVYTTKLNSIFFSKISENSQTIPNLHVLSSICYCARKLNSNSISFAAFAHPFLADSLLSMIESNFVPEIIPETLVPAFLWTEKQLDNLVCLHRDVFSGCIRLINSILPKSENETSTNTTEPVINNSNTNESSHDNGSGLYGYGNSYGNGYDNGYGSGLYGYGNGYGSYDSGFGSYEDEPIYDENQKKDIGKCAICGISDLISYMYNEDDLIISASETVLKYLKIHPKSKFALKYFSNLAQIRKGMKYVLQSILEYPFKLFTAACFINNFASSEEYSSLTNVAPQLINRFITLHLTEPEKISIQNLYALFILIVTQFSENGDIIIKEIISHLLSYESSDNYEKERYQSLLHLLEISLQNSNIDCGLIYSYFAERSKTKKDGLFIDFGAKVLLSKSFDSRSNGINLAQNGFIDLTLDHVYNSTDDDNDIKNKAIQYLLLIIQKESDLLPIIFQKLQQYIEKTKESKRFIYILAPIVQKYKLEIEKIWATFDENQKITLVSILEKFFTDYHIRQNFPEIICPFFSLSEIKKRTEATF